MLFVHNLPGFLSYFAGGNFFILLFTGFTGLVRRTKKCLKFAFAAASWKGQYKVAKSCSPYIPDP